MRIRECQRARRQIPLFTTSRPGVRETADHLQQPECDVSSSPLMLTGRFPRGPFTRWKPDFFNFLIVMNAFAPEPCAIATSNFRRNIPGPRLSHHGRIRTHRVTPALAYIPWACG